MMLTLCLAVASIVFPERRNVFTTAQDVRLLAVRPAVYALRNATGSLLREAVAADADQSGRFVLDFGRLPAGFYRLWQKGGEEAARFSVVPPDLQTTAADSVAQLDFGRNGTWDAARNERCAALAALAGVTWVRERYGYGWASYEPERGNLQTDGIMAFLVPEHQAGLKAMFHFMGLPAWAAAKGESGYGADLRDTYRSSAAVAERLKDFVRIWEYWNEPDSWPFGQGPAENLSAGQKALFLGVKSFDPTLPVTTAAPATFANRDFIDDCLANGIGKYYDYYNTHIYLLPEAYPGTFRGHEELMRQYGVDSRRRLISEAGSEAAKNDVTLRPPRWEREADVPNEDPDTVDWDLLTEDVREAVSATYVKCWTTAAAFGWEKYFTFCFTYYNEAGGSRVWGILGPGLIATSSYSALAAYNTLVGSRKCIGRMSSLPKGADGYVFGTPGDLTAVLWANDGAAFPSLRHKGVFAMTGDAYTAAPNRLGRCPVFVRLDAAPAIEKDSAPFTGPYRRSDPSKVSRIVLDFVRDTSDTPFRVNTHRRHILTENGQTITGVLNVYNFGETAFSGQVKGVWPKGWTGPADFEVEVPPMGRVRKPVSFTAPTKFFAGAARGGFDTDGGASMARATFECAQELDADKICDLTELSIEEVAQNKMSLRDGVLEYKFMGQPLCAFLTADATKRVKQADGLSFTLRRSKNAAGEYENSFGYIDVLLIDGNGNASWLQPNIFPVFLDGVEEECHCFRFDQFSPRIAAADVAKIQIRFNAFGELQGRTIIKDFSIWRRKPAIPGTYALTSENATTLAGCGWQMDVSSICSLFDSRIQDTDYSNPSSLNAYRQGLRFICR